MSVFFSKGLFERDKSFVVVVVTLQRKKKRLRRRRRQNGVVANCHADDDDDDDDERHRCGHEEDEEGATIYLCMFFVVVRATTLLSSRGLSLRWERVFGTRWDAATSDRSNPSSSLSRLARLSDFFFLRVPVWCRCRDAVVVVVVVVVVAMMSRLVARAFSSVDHESRSCMVSSNDAQIASMMNSHVHKTHRSNPSNERRKQRRRSLP